MLYIHTMNTNNVLRFLGWAALTYMWLEANCLFFNAIADAIYQHNEEIRQKAIENFKKKGGEDEGELESEVVETTVTKTFFKILNIHNTMSDNKLVKSILDAATITGLVAGVGWMVKKTTKENFTADPSANIMNYVNFTAVMAGSVALKKYLKDQKILSDNL